MSRRGLRRGGQQQWLAEAVGLKSASLLAALQFLTLSSPCCMRGLEVGQRRDRLAFPALVYWEAAKYRDPLGEERGGG